MENKRNFRAEQEKILRSIDGENPPRLLLHSCCAPCSSAVLEYLSEYFRITVFYFNPNIFPEEEFLHRIDEQKRLISELPCKNRVEFTERGWQQERFYAAVKGLEHIREGGERCFECYRLRLEETARLAAEEGYDYFTTTLSVSPYKNAQKLNAIGEELAEKYGVKHLPSDFKKKDGYKRSIELSAEYGLYRQNYCGCVFSKKEREAEA
ncbi:MAG: epoxyqueuosine reductase QueH [Oscillospiraceae bacterium]|nr:epoxyqueuosine reductase QueH [Oscillospiraceae bacterium]